MKRLFLLLAFLLAAISPLVADDCPTASGSWCSGLYQYDGMGNVWHIGADVYVYDPVGRIRRGTAEKQRGGVSEQDYAPYDVFGNRGTASRVAGSADCAGSCEQNFTIDSKTNHITSGGASYDAAGNLTAITSTMNGTAYPASYTYDASGSMTGMQAGSDVRQFVYTADDERIGTRNGQSWTWTVRGLDEKVLREYTSAEPNGQPGLPAAPRQRLKDYIWRDGQLLASVTTNGGGADIVQHFHLDHLGTPRLVTDDNGFWIGSVRAYYPFGAELNLGSEPSPGELMKFTGHERDRLANNPNTLDYMHARYEAATTGRFLSVDPSMDFDKTIRNPQMWNRYSYVVNNPIRYTDPDGREHVYEPDFTKPLSKADWSDAPPVIKGAFYVEGVLASEAAGELIGAAFRGVQTVTRYMSDGEADTARKTGNIPNTDAQGNPRPTHVTTDKPLNSSASAQKKYELPTAPTQRATVPKDRVPGGLGRTPDGRATTSGGGSQSATNQPIPVRPSEIKPLNQNLFDRVVGWFQ